MSRLLSSFREAVTSEVELTPEMSSFADEYPAIWEVFRGTKDQDGRWIIGPSSVLIFHEAGKLKFVLKPKFNNKVAFGTVSDPSKGLKGVEEAVVAGNFEWKTSKPPRSS